MPRLPIAELLVEAPTDAEAHLDPARVRHYAEHPDHPPVVVFQTAEGLLLADGHHRVAAARRRGEEAIEAELRPGSRHDAVRYAAEAGAAQRGTTVDDALAHIARHSDGRWGRSA